MIKNFWNSEEVNLKNSILSEDDKKIIKKWMIIQSIMDGQFEIALNHLENDKKIIEKGMLIQSIMGGRFEIALNHLKNLKK